LIGTIGAAAVLALSSDGLMRAIMSYQAIIIVLALALLLSGVAEQADNDLNEALGFKDTPLLQLIVGIGTGLLIWKSF
jgi:hypothetical protein